MKEKNPPSVFEAGFIECASSLFFLFKGLKDGTTAKGLSADTVDSSRPGWNVNFREWFKVQSLGLRPSPSDFALWATLSASTQQVELRRDKTTPEAGFNGYKMFLSDFLQSEKHTDSSLPGGAKVIQVQILE